MSTSLSYAFSPTVRDIIMGALRIRGAVQEGQDPSAYMLNNARQALEFIIKRMSIDKIPIWTRYQISVPIVAGRNPYTVGAGLNIDTGPTGTLTATDRPVDIHRINYKYANDGTEYQLTAIGRQDYLGYSLKSSQGVPNSWYFDKQTTNGNLFLYPVPDTTSVGDFLLIDVQRYIYDAGVDTNQLDMPIEMTYAVKWMLAEELAGDYPLVPPNPNRDQMIERKAKMVYEMMSQANGDTSSVYFLPDTRQDAGEY